MKLISNLLFAFTFVCFALQLNAQDGTVRGTLLDKETGEPLMFANVYLTDNPTTGTDTDMDGAFELKLAAGTYNISGKYVGYAEMTLADVIVKAGEVTVVQFPMVEEGINALGEGEEIVVVAQAINKSEVALIKLQQKSLTVGDAMSSQEMSRYGGSNAADNMKRVTGVSTVGGKYIYVRGLGDRYSSAQLNGQQMPSTDPYRNSVQFDLIPSNLLDNIIATKTFSPDQPGSFTGGNVNINTKTFPERYTLAASLGTSFNTISSLRNDFYTYEGGSTDFLGYDDGHRALPTALTDEATLEVMNPSFPLRAARDDDFARALNETSNSVNRTMQGTRGNSALNNSASFSIGNLVNIGEKANPLGFLLGVNYGRNYKAINGGATNNYDVNSGFLNPDRELFQYRGEEETTLGGLLNVGYKFGGSNKIVFNSIYNHNGVKSATSIDGFNPSVLSSGNYVEDEISLIERSLNSFQLNGEHALGEKGMKLTWGGGYVVSSQKEPDLRYFARAYSPNDDGSTSWAINAAEVTLPLHFWRELQDRQRQGKVDLAIPFMQNKSKTNQLKFGASYTHKDRDFSEARFQMQNQVQNNLSAIGAFDGDPALYFSEENVGWLGYDEQADLNQFGLFLTEDGRPENTYTGYEEINAAYAMTTLAVTEKLKAVAGVRAEQTKMFAESLATSKGIAEIDTLDFLPALNLIYAVNDKVNIRLSATQTLARPNLREISPFSGKDIRTGFVFTGNPDVQRSTIQNFDLRWELFPGAGELIAFSAYYKHFNLPIVQQFVPENSNGNEITWVNLDDATVYGIEAEFRKNLSFISDRLSKFKFSTNISYIHSVTDIPEDQHERIAADNPGKGFTRPLEGQSPYLVNAALIYADLEKGLNANISFNVFGERLVTLGAFGRPDIYEQPIPQLNASVSKQIGERLSFKVSAQNLLNARYQTVMHFNNEDYLINDFARGMTFGVGLSYQL